PGRPAPLSATVSGCARRPEPSLHRSRVDVSSTPSALRSIRQAHAGATGRGRRAQVRKFELRTEWETRYGSNPIPPGHTAGGIEISNHSAKPTIPSRKGRVASSGAEPCPTSHFHATRYRRERSPESVRATSPQLGNRADFGRKR